MAKSDASGTSSRTFLGEMFDRFVEQSAVTVMTRATIENALAPKELDALFERDARRQYTRELLFSTLVALMSVVVCRVRKSVHAAYQAMAEEIPASVTALYKKLAGMEPELSGALVRHTARRLREVVEASGGALPPPLPGYRVRILDGNHLRATHRRLKVLRGSHAGPLPGFGLVVLDPALMLATDLIVCEDGHAQERSLTDEILGLVEPNDVWVDDRNFCTTRLLFGIADKGAFFVTRQHAASLRWRPVGTRCKVGRVDGGTVYEQAMLVWLDDPLGRLLHVRRITVALDKATRDGEAEIHILTNLPEQVPAERIAELYRQRWDIETLFAELERNLDGEIDTLGYPKAALFAFATALVAYNALSTVKAALRARHGAQTIEQTLSAYFLADEISGTYRGMMIALPEPQWLPFRDMTAAELATQLVRFAAHVKLPRLAKHRSGPRGPRRARVRYRGKTHVSTARLLARQRRSARAR